MAVACWYPNTFISCIACTKQRPLAGWFGRHTLLCYYCCNHHHHPLPPPPPPSQRLTQRHPLFAMRYRFKLCRLLSFTESSRTTSALLSFMCLHHHHPHHHHRYNSTTTTTTTTLQPLPHTDKSRLVLFETCTVVQARNFYGGINDQYSTAKAVFSRLGDFVYCTSQDNTVVAWNVTTQKVAAQIAGHKKTVVSWAAMLV